MGVQGGKYHEMNHKITYFSMKIVPLERTSCDTLWISMQLVIVFFFYIETAYVEFEIVCLSEFPLRIWKF